MQGNEVGQVGVVEIPIAGLLCVGFLKELVSGVGDSLGAVWNKCFLLHLYMKMNIFSVNISQDASGLCVCSWVSLPQNEGEQKVIKEVQWLDLTVKLV